MNIHDYIHVTNQVTDANVLFQIFLDNLEVFGFDRVVYSSMTDSLSLNRKAQHGIFHNYPEDWMKYYKEKNYVNYDPVYQTAFVARQPFSWNGLYEKQPLKPKQKRVMQEAQEAGLKDGVALSIHGPLGEIVGIGLASSSGRVNTGKDVLAEIHAIVNQFHLCHLSIVGKECSNINEIVPSLSEREKTILTWAAKNKSNSVISEIMNISPKTVEFHLANSYKKLGVNGRVMAVLMAFRLGLIFI